MDNLAELPDIRELYFVGNPLTDWEHWKDYLIARLPTLGRLDGTDITKSMRMEALQKLKFMEKDLVQASKARIEKKVLESTLPKDPNAYSKEFRRECYREQVQQKEENERQRKENSMFKDYEEFNKDLEQKDIPVYNAKGEVRQANQGKYEWRFDETVDKTSIIFEIKIPKYMDTSAIKVDLQPNYLRLDIKGRVTQLSIPEDILVEKSKIQRSMTTGCL